MTAGFVLGEALALLGIVAVYMIAAMTLAFLLALLPCLFIEAAKRSKAGKGETEKRKETRDRQMGRRETGGREERRRKAEKGIWMSLGCVSLLLGFWRGEQAVSWSREELALSLDGTRRQVCGEVLTARPGEGQLILNLKNCVIVGEEKAEGYLRRLQIYLDGGSSLRRPVLGSRISVEGELRAFSAARNPGEFDYGSYYRSLGMNYRMFADSWQEAGKEGRWGREILYQGSVHAGEILERIADPKDAGIFRAAILGERSQLDGEIRALYQKSGIAHLLAISGLHLSLVSAAVYGTLRRLGAGYGRAGILGGILLTLYAGMTGASPSVMRALVMALCGFLAAYLGRTYDLPSALGLAACLLLWENPHRLCQSGVQLSFGAVAGIAVITESPGEEKTGKYEQAVKMLSCSFGMQMMTLPLVLYHFFQYPLYGIFLNLLTVPLMGVVVASGAAGILLGSIWLPAGRFAVRSGHIVLRFYEWLCRLWERLPGSLLILGRPQLWQISVYFGVLAAVLWGWRKRRHWYWKLLLAGLPLLLLPLPVRGMETTFLDVGQGDGICIRTRTETILIDGGSTDQRRLGENRLEPFLKSKGIAEVDYAIVSHGDQDHISGLIYLLEKSEIAIRTLVLPDIGGGEEIYSRLEQLARRQGGEVLWMKRGDRLKCGRLEITCRYPESEDRRNRERNEHSLVLQVDYGGFHMLLTGDMSAEGEKCLLDLENSEPLDRGTPGLEDIQILKVAHHGSRYSTTEAWLDHVSPKWAVLSYGENNRYGHPGQQIVDRMKERRIQIWETARSGAISLRTDGKKIWWRTFLWEK